MPYNTVTTADEYFAALFGYVKWDDLDEPTKLRALASAQQQLDTLCSWYGYKCEDDQPNAFPRTPDCPDVPDDVLSAECEIAYAIVDTNSTSTAGKQQLQSLDAEGKLQWFSGRDYTNPIVNEMVTSLLSRYGLCSGSGSTTMIEIGRA